ncbi:MAG TPA: EscU/YscU/HrcU family type III secretion system export apparatus switch protein [Gammaproteobacteria bacterium]|nr:EscU/YscU/HrcU family type III secretion system export apparatus switch protein [Gammaproteobacteria bacterium]
MAATEDQDKTEEATPFKLRDARKRGQVAKSVEVGSVILMAGFILMLLATLDDIASVLAATARKTLISAGQVRLTSLNVGDWLAHVMQPMVLAISPLLIAFVVLAVTGNLLQTGPVLSTDPLKPDFNRLNPATGLKRIFSFRSLFELAKTLIKLGLLTAFLWIGAGYFLRHLPAYAVMTPMQVPRMLGILASRGLLILMALFGLVAVLDLVFARREFAKKMRMSRRELKDEHKRHEGDPEIKSKRRRLQKEVLSRVKSVGRVKDADVIFTNPTHVAVALRYRPRDMLAPKVLSLGAGFMAARIRRAAQRHAVPVVRNAPLARALYRECVLDGPIPESLYREVAPTYQWLMTLPGAKVNLA